MAPAPARILAYADGACEGNPGPGGWGVVIVGPFEPMEFSGSDPQTTNNRMELTAAIEALRHLKPGAHVTLRSDSQYLVNTMNLGWRRNKNHDLWKALDAEVAKRDVRFEWVQGHAGDPLNETADRLAREAAALARGRRAGAAVSRAAGAGRAAASAGPVLEMVDVAESAAVAAALRPLLDANEELARCAACGGAFVAANGARYCTRAPCQLAARRASR
ncbi:MAG TPA: ribonuclease H [Candidatus Binataceae bacterium]|nr:ribonuclease H [Candidatus Binataceae bacterium]